MKVADEFAPPKWSSVVSFVSQWAELAAATAAAPSAAARQASPRMSGVRWGGTPGHPACPDGRSTAAFAVANTAMATTPLTASIFCAISARYEINIKEPYSVGLYRLERTASDPRSADQVMHLCHLICAAPRWVPPVGTTNRALRAMSGPLGRVARVGSAALLAVTRSGPSRRAAKRLAGHRGRPRPVVPPSEPLR